MTDDPRINELVEELLESELTPEEVCRDFPELLPAVQARWEKVFRLQGELDAFFPSSTDGRNGPSSPTLNRSINTLQIPGYEILSVLGQGGMGVVYQARQLNLNRIVALKMLLGMTYRGSIEQERFQREAEAVASLHSANIIQIYDVGENQGQPYYTMEFVEGGSLAQALAGTPLPTRQAAEKAILLADAVAIAHASCIVHRDLKPSNILLTSDGTLKITDFGLARKLSNDSDLTMSGAKLGTPSYMAPEQALGQPNSICPTVDIYALGAILYEMLTGRPPFRGETASETERQVISEEPVLPSRLNPRVPKDLETIALKCIRKNPDHRYRSANELSDDLHRFLRCEPIHARPVGRTERTWRWIHRHPSTTGLILTAVLLCVIALGALWREQEYRVRHRAESARWTDRLAYMSRLQQENRFAEARAVLQDAHTDDPELQDKIEQARSQLSLVEELDSVRLGRDRLQDNGNINYAASSKQYEAIFLNADLGTYQDDPEITADKMLHSPVRKALVAALDDWAACAEKKERDWVLRVARRLDPDPWRDRIRDTDGWAKKENFPALAEDAEVAAQPVTLMVAFGTRWRRLGGDPTSFLERVQRQHPSDFWVNFELCHLLENLDTMKSLSYSRAALAVRPDSSWVNYKLGICHAKLKQDVEAIPYFRRALNVDSGFNIARISLGTSLATLGKTEQAIDEWKRVLAVKPELSDIRRAVVGYLIQLGKPQEAKEYWRSLLQGRSTNFEDWDGYAELCLFLDDSAEYTRACNFLLKHFGSPNDPRDCERLGRTCLLFSNSSALSKTGSKLIIQALSADKKTIPDWVEPYFLFAYALAEYRLDRFDEAALILQGKASGVLPPAPKLVLSMVSFKQGNDRQAKHLLNEALHNFDWKVTNALTREQWIYHILRKEAEQLILHTGGK
ncbi:MAG: protein kinase [Planctomycetia bacterium]|nr:protein kinase [Planctomycetia bacterium]